MSAGDRVRFGAIDVVLLEHALYADAHPDEAFFPADARCPGCAWGLRLDTEELVLLWLAGGQDWIVSRADPHWARHRDAFARGAA